MKRPPVLIYEKADKWTAALRCALAAFRSPGAAAPAASRRTIVQLRSLADLAAEIKTGRASVVLVELTAGNAARVLDFVARHGEDSPAVRFVVVAGPAEAGWEPAARLAGAAHFATTLFDLQPIVPLVQFLQPLPPESETLAERVWRELPWRPVAAAKT